MKTVAITRDDFENWLASLDDSLESLFSAIPEELRNRLDFSAASLDIVESLILQKYRDVASMLEPDQSSSLNALAAYVGETFRKGIGGRWDIRLDDPKFAFHGIPVLVGAGTSQKTMLCPFAMVTASADRRTGKYLRTIFENNLRS
jgi:hypothetical protein